ncbi:hypothetical protein FRB96_002897 [Tulasnella sp. 330]|nr:hypothetical protein FRB96_002897 [Tulasnella sp. 330]KAG8884355.1 hypothetical protein FRB98_002434 [Tulasnella sp. 332]KAG8884944.1 hypothetical protein FRB97_002772 [Tulasnella sp. 331]
MTITSPLEIRTQLASALGSGGLPYWRMLTDFLQGNIGRVEFEELVRRWINTSELVVLHNSLIFAILYKASHPVVVEVSTAPVQGPPKKKRKIIPHQDPPPQLQKWITGMGKAERDRVRQSNANGRRGGHPTAPSFGDDVASERPVTIRAEGTYRPGTHVAQQIGSLARTLPNLQHLSSRMDLIASQHQMTASKPAVSLLAAAVEVYLKQITVHALTATSGSLPFASISPSEPNPHPPLSVQSFHTLFTLAPFEQPIPSASVTELMQIGGLDQEEDEDLRTLGRNLDPTNRQILRLLASRSGLKEGMMAKMGRKAVVRTVVPDPNLMKTSP